MGKKVFITVCGAGAYDCANYNLDGERQSCYSIDKFLFSVFEKQGRKFDRVVVLLTTKAEEVRWNSFLCGTRNGTPDENDKEGLRDFFARTLTDIKAEPVHIADGNNDEELLSIFKSIYSAIEPGDEITFHVTHGFRIFPLLFFPVITYSKAMKNITIDNIYYGLFRAANEDVPIIDIKLYDDILECSNAAHNFIQFGNARDMLSFTEKIKKEAPQAQKATYDQLRKMAKSMNDLTTTILTCNSGKGIISTFERAKNQQTQLNDGDIFAPMDMLVRHAFNAASDVFGNVSEEYQCAIAVVEWSLERDLIQLGFRAIRESVDSYYCCLFAPDKCKVRKYREKVIGAAVNSVVEYVRNRKNEAGITKNREHLASGEYAADVEIFDKVTEHLKAHPEVVDTIKNIEERRNELNHFNMREKTRAPENYREDLKKYYAKIKAFFENGAEAKEPAAEHVKKCFVNFSNHPSDKWCEAQRAAALEMAEGGIVDVPFTAVPPDTDECEVARLAEEAVAAIMAKKPAAVMCMGEFGLSYEVITQLRSRGVKVVYSCSERVVKEKATETGTLKEVVFNFVRFREY